METQNKLNHSIQISKMAKNLIILLFFKQHLFQPISLFEQNFAGICQATQGLRIA